jgi:hypothetical protein
MPDGRKRVKNDTFLSAELLSSAKTRAKSLRARFGPRCTRKPGTKWMTSDRSGGAREAGAARGKMCGARETGRRGQRP